MRNDPTEPADPLTSSRRSWAILAAAAIIISTFAVYWQTTGHPFIELDDPLYVTDNPRVKAGISPEGIAWAFTATEAANWHPLTWLSHMLDVELFGMDAGKHHLTNVLFHAANAALLLLVLFRMTGALWPSAFSAALFALHPLHVESVAWVAERKDVLSTFFMFLTLWSYARYAERPGPGRYAPVLLLFALGLLSKPMLVTLPFALLLLDFWPLGRLSPPGKGGGAPLPRLLAEKVPLFALSAASCVVTWLAQAEGGAMNALGAFPLRTRLANAAVSCAAYLGKTVWPVSLAVFYPHPGNALPAWQVAGAVLLLGGLTALSIALLRRAPYLAVGWFWYLGTLVPVLGLVPVGAHAMADRYTYVPLVGLFVAIAWGIDDLAAGLRHRKRILAVGAVTLLCAATALTVVQARYWRSGIALFSRALEVTTNNGMAQHNLGVIRHKQGRMDLAVMHYREAIRITPMDSLARYNYGNALLRLGDAEGAARQYREAIMIRQNNGMAHYNLGVVLSNQGRIDDAVSHFRQAVRYNSGDAQAHHSLGLLLLRKGDAEGAVRQLLEARRINPGDPAVASLLKAALAARGAGADASTARETGGKGR